MKNSAENWPRGQRVRSISSPRRCSELQRHQQPLLPPWWGQPGGWAGRGGSNAGERPKGRSPLPGDPEGSPPGPSHVPTRRGCRPPAPSPRPGPRPGPQVVRDGRFIGRGGIRGMSGGRGGLICEPHPHPRCWRPLRSAGEYRSRGWSPSRATGSPGGGCEGAGRALEGEFGPGASAPRAPSPSLRARARAPVSAPTVTIYACLG